MFRSTFSQAAKISSRDPWPTIASENSGCCRANDRHASMCRCARTVGLSIVNSVCTGWPSNAPNSTGFSRKHKRDHRPRHVHHHRIAHVRQGDPLADGRRSQRLPGKQHLEQKLPIDHFRQRHQFHDRTQDLGLVLAADAIVDSPGLQGIDQPGRRGAVVRLVENIGRDFHPLRGGPFQQFRPIEAILLVHPIGRQLSLLDPTIDGFFRYAQKLSGVLHAEFHRRLSSPKCGTKRTLLDKEPKLSSIVRRFKGNLEVFSRGEARNVRRNVTRLNPYYVSSHSHSLVASSPVNRDGWHAHACRGHENYQNSTTCPRQAWACHRIYLLDQQDSKSIAGVRLLFEERDSSRLGL